MAGWTNTMLSGLQAEAAVVLNVTGASSVPVEAVPGTPYVYFGPPRLAQVAGNWEQRIYLVTMHYLIARVAEPVDQTALNDALDLVLNAFRTGVDLSAQSVVPAPICEILAADTDKFYTLAGTDYQSIDFTWQVSLYQAASYTP